MAIIVNITWSIQPAKHAQFLADLSVKLPVTRAYDGCFWLYLVENLDDSDGGIVEAVSMWESKEKYDAYLDFREKSGELAAFEKDYYTADPAWKFMPVLMDFNK